MLSATLWIGRFGMNGRVMTVLLAAVAPAAGWLPVPPPATAAPVAATPQDSPVRAAADTPAAAFTRNQALKVRVSVDFTEIPLGDILKELAHLAEEQTERPLLWAYGPGFPYDRKVTFAAKNQPLDVVLDQLLSRAGEGLGYVVVSQEGDKYDGWVRLTTTGERGQARPPAGAEDEAAAAEKLDLARRLIESGQGAAARPVLELILRKYPSTRAAAAAKELLPRTGMKP